MLRVIALGDISPLKNHDIFDILNISRYIGNISGDFGKYRPAKKICKKFEKNILNISRYIQYVAIYWEYIERFWKISPC